MITFGFISAAKVLTPRQQATIENRVRELHSVEHVSLIVHAGKQGADTFVHSLALSMGIKVHIQRSNLMPKVAHCTGPGVKELPRTPWHQHNAAILGVSNRVLVASEDATSIRLNRATWVAVWASAPNRPTEVAMPSGRLRRVYCDGTIDPYTFDAKRAPRK